MARNTSTGRVLEELVIPSLRRGGYSLKEQAIVGVKVNGSKHRVDVLVGDEPGQILVSLKWQQTSGTAEQKVPFEVINLIHACQEYGYKKAYLVLGGVDNNSSNDGGWTLRQWYLDRGLAEYIEYEQYVELIKPEEFVALANAGRL